MKIVIGTESFWPIISGVAVFARDLAENLVKNGDEVIVVAPSKNGKSGWDELSKIKIYRVGGIANPLRRGARISFRVYGKIKNILDQFQTDIIHIQDPAGIGGALVRYGNEKKIKTVMTNHFNIDFISAYLRPLGPIKNIIENMLIKRFVKLYEKCDAITTPSETSRERIEKWGLKKEITILRNGVDIERFKPADKKTSREKLNLPDKKTVIYSGRMDVDKSVKILLEAIPKILDEVDAYFLFVGGGKDLDWLKDEAEKLKIAENVKFYGFLKNESEEYALVYQASDLYFSASKIEVQSIVMLEAFASGLPVVAAAAGSFPEFIEKGQNGLLFRPDDSENLAEKVIRILKDDEMESRMAKESRKVAEEYRKDKMMNKFREFYKGLLGK
ncbi:MAG: glycosyltransferase [Patescibacteria group bacterium]